MSLNFSLVFRATPPRSHPPSSKPQHILAESETQLPATLFHDHWWLSAATNGEFQEAVVTNGSGVVGRLPYVITRERGFAICQMPPFTHVLGPVVYPGSGKPQTQLLRRLSIVRDLIDQLPEHHGFFHALDSASVDGLAFQDRGYHVAPQYTFEIDCRDDPETLWAAMHFKTRQHVRRAEDKFSVATVQDPDEFINFYLENLKKQRLVSYVHWTNFPEVFRQASVRDSGEILCARWADGRPAAMVFLAWGRGKMYYLLSTRAQDAGDNGSVNLLIWSSMKRAHSRGLLFDLDGVSTSGTARFLSGFNGTPKIRHIVRKMSFTYGAMQYAKRQIFGVRRNSSTFT